MSEQAPVPPLSPGTSSPAAVRTAVKAPRFLASRQQPSKSMSDVDTPPRPVREDRAALVRTPPPGGAGEEEEKTSPRPSLTPPQQQIGSPRPPPRNPAPSVPLPPTPDAAAVVAGATGVASPRTPPPRTAAPLPPGPSPRSSNRPPIPTALKTRTASNAGVGSPSPPVVRPPTPARTTQAAEVAPVAPVAVVAVAAVAAAGPTPLLPPREDELEYELDARDELLFRYILEGASVADLQQSGQRKRGESFF